MKRNRVGQGLKRLLRTTAFAMSTLVLVHCGGGGGGDSTVSGEAPPTNGTELNAGLTGKFWYREPDSDTYYHAGAANGVVSKFADRPSSQPTKYLTPSPDGTKYLLFSIYSDPLTDEESTKLEVFDSATKTSQGSITLDGYATNFRFSPDNKYLGMLRSTGLLDKHDGITVVDLSNPAALKTVVSFLGSSALFVSSYDWLPNGQYMYLRSDNKLFTATPASGGDDDQLKGSVTPPAGHETVRSLDVSPDGSQVLLQFNWKEGPLTKVDVWVADATGANLERVSTSNLTVAALWSPDGQYIAMKTDAGAYCVTGACDSYCKRWYAPKTARGVNERTGGGGIALRAYSGSNPTQPTGLQCNSEFAWTR